MSDWREAKAPDGRTYYYHAETKETRWEKPEELGAADPNEWQEYTTDDGRKYYHNRITNQTTWEVPAGLDQAQATPSSLPQKPATPVFVAGGQPYQPTQNQDGHHDHQQRRHYRDHRGTDRHSHFSHSDGVRGFVPASTHEPQYANLEEAEAAFFKVLKRSGITPDSLWDDSLKVIIKDPEYRALKDPKDRRAAFERFKVESRQQEQDRERERLTKLRQDFAKMLRSHPEIKHYTRWRTARPIIEGEAIFRSASDDAERRQLFDEYISGLKRAQIEKEHNDRQSALTEIYSVLEALNLDPYVTWSKAKDLIEENETFQDDDKFRALTNVDVLTAFESHVKSLERALNEKKQKDKFSTIRAERQNREAFMEMLKDLRSSGKIMAGTKWKDIHPLIESDERYLGLLGQPGSTPLDFFWDILEQEETMLRRKRNSVLDMLDDAQFEITPDTPVTEFTSVVRKDQRASNLTDHELQLIFERLHEKVMRKYEEDRHQHDRRQRRAVDALRSAIKHMYPPVTLSDSWDDVRPRLEQLSEYQAVESDENRRSALERHHRRLKEKEEEASRYSDRGDSRRKGSKRHASSRTPEADVYEADRRKAQAERERHYHKTSSHGVFFPYLAFPSPYPDIPDPPRRFRYRRFHRDHPDYDLDRHSAYSMSRADPRDNSAKILDYDDTGRAGSMETSRRSRRERDDEEDGEVPERKRQRRDSKTDVDATPSVKEEEQYKSGSEEGEIEEM